MDIKFLVMIVAVTILFLVGTILGGKLDKKLDPKLYLKEEKDKACPPHKWLSEEQVGMPGTFFMRCLRCRKLPGWDMGKHDE